MKAIFVTGGKQYYVSEGETIFVEKLDTEVGKDVTFDEVLMVDDKIGNPLVEGAKVTGEVIKNGKQSKIVVYKYVQKNNYHKRQGHRQPYTKVEIKSIKA